MSQVSTPDIVSVAAGDTRTLASIDALLDDRGQSRTLRHTLIGIVAGVIVLFAWAMFAQVDELARARGEVQPGGHVQVLQSQEGGTIVKLHVEGV
jgi:adhesin transport system membrane fusion protein